MTNEPKTADEMTDDELRAFVHSFAGLVASTKLDVILMVGQPDPTNVGHSRYYVTKVGQCLPLLGLLDVGSQTLKASLLFPRKL